MSTPNYAWDTTVLISWLCEDQSAPLANIAMVVKEIDDKQANLILSVTTYSEVLESKYSAAQLDLLDRFMRRSNVIPIDTTTPIATKAAKIRDRGLQDGRKIKTPDATVIAAAILHKANVLHSLDKGMLSLSGSSTVDGLAIVKPCLLSGQGSLFNPIT